MGHCARFIKSFWKKLKTSHLENFRFDIESTKKKDNMSGFYNFCDKMNAGNYIKY